MQRSKLQEMENAKIIIFYMSKGERSDYNSYRSTPHKSILDLAFVQIILLRLQKLAMCLYSESELLPLRHVSGRYDYLPLTTSEEMHTFNDIT